MFKGADWPAQQKQYVVPFRKMPTLNLGIEFVFRRIFYIFLEHHNFFKYTQN